MCKYYIFFLLSSSFLWYNLLSFSWGRYLCFVSYSFNIQCNKFDINFMSFFVLFVAFFIYKLYNMFFCLWFFFMFYVFFFVLLVYTSFFCLICNLRFDDFLSWGRFNLIFNIIKYIRSFCKFKDNNLHQDTLI